MKSNPENYQGKSICMDLIRKFQGKSQGISKPKNGLEK